VRKPPTTANNSLNTTPSNRRLPRHRRTFEGRGHPSDFDTYQRSSASDATYGARAIGSRTNPINVCDCRVVRDWSCVYHGPNDQHRSFRHPFTPAVYCSRVDATIADATIAFNREPTSEGCHPVTCDISSHLQRRKTPTHWGTLTQTETRNREKTRDVARA
jgi:hypothetical protein